MPKQPYRPPVATLLTYGECKNLFSQKWPNYVEKLGFDATHIPELIRMAVDAELNQADPDSLEVWAPAHAWRTLGQLGEAAEGAAKPLLNLLKNIDDDWGQSEIPTVLTLIGPSVIPAVEKYLANPKHDYLTRIPASECLSKMGIRYPEARVQCIDILGRLLLKEKNTNLNGFLVAALCDLKAIEKAPEIEQAFAQKRVDLRVSGDWNEVQVELGLKTRREVSKKGGMPTEASDPISSKEAISLLDALESKSFSRKAKKHDQPEGFGSISARKKGKTKKKKR